MTTRVACVGAGYFSQFHLEGWARLKTAKVVGVADHVAAKAEATGFPAYTDFARMLDQTKPDILDVVLPPPAQAAAVRHAISHGVKVIICQKPFCTSLTEATTLVDLAHAHDVTLIVHENFRFQPWYRTIRDAIRAGDIGTPLQGTFRLRPGDGQGPDAYLARQPYFRTMPRFMVHETGVHFADVFRYLFGNPIALYADLRQINPVISGEDAGHIIFDHPDGVRTTLDANRCLDHAAENPRCTMGEATFEGTDGTLYLSGDGAVTLRRSGTMDHRSLCAPVTTKIFGGDCTFFLQEHVLGYLSGRVPLENEASDYLNVLKIEKAIYRSAQRGQKVYVNDDQ